MYSYNDQPPKDDRWTMTARSAAAPNGMPQVDADAWYPDTANMAAKVFELVKQYGCVMISGALVVAAHNNLRAFAKREGVPLSIKTANTLTIVSLK